MSTLSTTALPAISVAVRETSGAAARHAPVQKSTSTGTEAFWTTSSNKASSAGRGSAIGGKGDLQIPQRPALARYFAGTRLFC